MTEKKKKKKNRDKSKSRLFACVCLKGRFARLVVKMRFLEEEKE